MIQLKTPYTFVKSNNILTGTLTVEIICWETYRDFKIYKIEDSIIDSEGVKTVIDTRYKRVELTEINQFGAYLATLGIDFDAMTEMERAWEKARYALLPFVQTDLMPDGVHTIYGKLPADWEYSNPADNQTI